MLTLKETKDWLADLWQLTVDINISIKNARRVTQNIYDNEPSAKKLGFFYHYKFQQHFILAIQLCKVLDDRNSQKRAINKLFVRLKKDEYDKELIEQIQSNKFVNLPSRPALLVQIESLQKLLTEHRKLIADLIEVRDKNYAHYDPNRSKIGLTLDQYEQAVDLASVLYNKLTFQLFGSTTHFGSTDDWSIDPILKTLSNEMTKWLTDQEKKRSN